MLRAHPFPGKPMKSAEKIPKSVDRAMKTSNSNSDKVEPGISVRYGPVDEMDVDEPERGASNGKRKSRASVGNSRSYKELTSDSEDDMPLVRRTPVSTDSTFTDIRRPRSAGERVLPSTLTLTRLLSQR